MADSGKNYNIYIGDLHMHSTYSDGENSVDELVISARKAGLDFIAITDHNTVEGGHHAKALISKLGLNMLAITGEEISAEWGHLLALNTQTHVDVSDDPRVVCSAVKSQGGYVFASHPYWMDTRVKFWDSGLFDLLLKDKQINGFELINAGAVPPYDNMPVIQKYHSMRLKKEFYPVIGDSDAHSAAAVGKDVRMYVLAESLTETAIMGAILEGRCVIEWQKRFYGEDKYFSEIDLWYRENFIEHLQQCRQETAKH